ncbi:MAG: WG repeat-containing protein [Ferruginibacter sp.]
MKYILLVFFLAAGIHCFSQAPVVYTASNGMKGFKNKDGQIIIPAKYSEVTGDFKSGPLRVKLNNKYGYVGSNGVEIIKPQYDSADNFYFWGQADVQIGKEKFTIDTLGKKTSSMFDVSYFLDSTKISDFNLFKANDFAALGKVNMICDKFDNGTYYGEALDNKADGYGMYIFEDSSFYAGEFSSGTVYGKGILYNKTDNTIWVANWNKGQPVNDYMNVVFNDYKAQWFTMMENKSVFRSAMQINKKFVITSNMMGALTGNKRNLINILDETSLSTMYGALDNDLQYDGNYISFDYPSTLKVNKVNHGVYEKNVTTEPAFNNSAIPNAEKTIGYKVTDFIYPIKGITAYVNGENYFGRTDNNIPQGFGSYSSEQSNFHLLTSMFSAGQPTGFKQEVFNMESIKYFYSGNFKEEWVDKKIQHSGTFAKVIYHQANDVNIEIGDFAIEGNLEALKKGINFKVGPGVCSVIFTDKTGKEEIGYLMLPKDGNIYRGGMKNEKAEGLGEALAGKNNTIYKTNWINGASQAGTATLPSWSAPYFLNIFDKPLWIIDEK